MRIYPFIILNDALSMENAAVERLQTRIKQTRLQDSKVQLQHHLEETRQQQVRLKQLISDLGGKATRDKGRLSIPSSSKSIENLIKKHMTDAEAELKTLELIISSDSRRKRRRNTYSNTKLG